MSHEHLKESRKTFSETVIGKVESCRRQLPGLALQGTTDSVLSNKTGRRYKTLYLERNVKNVEKTCYKYYFSRYIFAIHKV